MSFLRKGLLPLVLAVAFLLFVGCDDSPGTPRLPPENGPDGPIGGPVLIDTNPGAWRWPYAVPQPPIDPNDPRTFTVKKTLLNFDEVDGELVPVPFSLERPRLIHEVWIGLDTNADPRNVLGYRLVNSGRHLFDRVVLFHAVLAWDHLDPDAQDPTMPPIDRRHWCNRTDIHMHLHDRIQWLLADHAKFIQPLLDAGMEVLICPLGGSQGICIASIGVWPQGGGNNEIWNQDPASGGRFGPWEEIGGGYNPRRFAREKVEFMETWGLHGLALNDEFCHVIAGGWGLRNVPHGGGGAQGGRNIFRWLRYFKDMSILKCDPSDPFNCAGLGDPLWWDVSGNISDPAHGGACSACPRPNGFLVTVYSHGTVRLVPEYYEMESWRLVDGHFVRIPARRWNINDIFDGLSQDQYGVWNQYVQPATVHRSRRGAFSVAFDGAGPQVTPSIGTMPGFSTNLMNQGFGLIMYFALRQRTHYVARAFFTRYVGDQMEIWATPMTERLYRDGVYFRGFDYPFFPAQRRGSTAGTGALFRPNPPFGDHPRDFALDHF